jgi:hypothetical protein
VSILRRAAGGRFARDLRAAVAESRRRGFGWEHIAAVLNVTPDEAERVYGRRRGLRGGAQLVVALAQRLTT